MRETSPSVRPHRACGWAPWTLGLGLLAQAASATSADYTLATLDPGHFHAALFQREMLPGIASETYVYAPLGRDLSTHLGRVAAYNTRPTRPTCWTLRVYAGPDYVQRMLDEKHAQIVVISGRNGEKIDRIQTCLRAGLHVLADKPWVICDLDLPKLEAALDEAEARGVVGYDAMTQRFEITAIVQRALVNDREVFGTLVEGSPTEPAVTVESLHYLLKEVDGVPALRPPWFFDIGEQGEGLADVGTHLVDMVQWVLFPNAGLDYRSEVRVLRGRRWPTLLTLADFRRVTGERDFPQALRPREPDTPLSYFCNNAVDYTIRGIHVRLQTAWDFAAPPGRMDSEALVFRGQRARVEVRQDPEDQYRREVYVVPNPGTARPALEEALQRRVALLATDHPGLAVEQQAARFRVVIPDHLRASHEQHFAQVVGRFLAYAREPRSLPAWEKQNMLAKYFVTTRGVALARQNAALP